VNALPGLGAASRVAGAAVFVLLAAATGSAREPSPAPQTATASRDRGIALLQKGDVGGALAELRTAVAMNPKDAVTQDSLGIALGESGLTDAAASAFREAIRLDPGRAEAYFHLGVVLDRLGRSQEAVSAFHSALRLRPESLEARYGLSVVLARLGDLDGTILLLRAVTEGMPSLVDAHYDLGLHLWNRYRSGRGLPRPADLDEAERELRKAVEQDPTRPRSRLVLGQLLAERKRMDEAVDQLRQASKLAGNDPAYAYDLGLALRLQGDLEGAEAQLRAALAGDPKHGQARRALGLILRENGDLDAAVVELRLSVAERPGDAQGRNVLGGLLLKLGDLEGAIDEFRHATRLDPRLTEAHVNLGQAFGKAGRRDEARAALAEVQRLKEQEAGLSRAMVLAGMATGQLEKGDVAAAVVNLREAVGAAPDLAEVHHLLGLGLQRASASPAEAEASAPPAEAEASAPPAEAEEALLRAVQLDPVRAKFRYEWARLLSARGDTEGALGQLRKAVELQPSLVEAQTELSVLALRSQDWATAASALTAVLSWGGGDAAVHRDLATALDGLGRRDEAAKERAEARKLEAAGTSSRR
jgi:Flp pilus assembly protein TadD